MADLAAFQPAIAGFRAGGRDAKGHDAPGPRRGGPLFDGGPEGGSIGDHLVRGRKQHKPLRLGALQMQGCGQGRGGSIAPHRLDQDGLGRDLHLVQLLGHDDTEIFPRDDDRGSKPKRIKATGGGLEQAFITDQRHELFREPGPRDRPKPRSGAPCKQHGGYQARTNPAAHQWRAVFIRTAVHVYLTGVHPKTSGEMVTKG